MDKTEIMDKGITEYKEKEIKTTYKIGDEVFFLTSHGLDNGKIQEISSKLDRYGIDTSYEVKSCYGEICNIQRVNEKRCFKSETDLLDKMLGNKYDLSNREFKIKDVGNFMIRNMPNTNPTALEIEYEIEMITIQGGRYIGKIKFETMRVWEQNKTKK